MPSPQDEKSSPASSKSKEASLIGGWYAVAGIGFEFAAAIGLFGLLGWYLDKRWQTSPWMLLIGLVVGFALGLYLIVKVAKRAFHD